MILRSLKLFLGSPVPRFPDSPEVISRFLHSSVPRLIWSYSTVPRFHGSPIQIGEIWVDWDILAHFSDSSEHIPRLSDRVLFIKSICSLISLFPNSSEVIPRFPGSPIPRFKWRFPWFILICSPIQINLFPNSNELLLVSSIPRFVWSYSPVPRFHNSSIQMAFSWSH